MPRCFKIKHKYQFYSETCHWQWKSDFQRTLKVLNGESNEESYEALGVKPWVIRYFFHNCNFIQKLMNRQVQSSKDSTKKMASYERPSWFFFFTGNISITLRAIKVTTEIIFIYYNIYIQYSSVTKLFVSNELVERTGDKNL